MLGLICKLEIPESIAESTDEAAKKLENEDVNDSFISSDFNLRLLSPCLVCIFHNFGVVTTIYYQPDRLIIINLLILNRIEINPGRVS